MTAERQDFEHPWGTELEMSYQELREKVLSTGVKIHEPCITLDMLHIPEDRFNRTMVIVLDTGGLPIWTFRDNPDSARSFVGTVPEISQLMSRFGEKGAVG